MRRLLSIIVVLAAVAAAAAQQAEPGQAGPGENDVRSRDLSTMFYTDTLPVAKPPATATPHKAASKQPKPLQRANATSASSAIAASGMERRVGAKLTLLMHDADCNVQEVPTTRVFESGEQLRLQIESNVDGYLSVLEKGSSGSETLLFPNPRINGGQNHVQRGVQYSVPPTGWFTFNAQPGEEHLLIVVSRKPLSWLPAAGTPAAEPAQSPPVQMTATLSALQRTVQERDLVLFEEKAPKVGAQPQSAQSLIVLNTSDTQNDTVYVRLTLKHR